MKNWIAPGMIVMRRPYRTVSSGEGILQGSEFLVALSNLTPDKPGAFVRLGVVELPTDAAHIAGSPVYWSEVEKKVLPSPTEANEPCIGVAASNTSGTKVWVCLHGMPIGTVTTDASHVTITSEKYPSLGTVRDVLEMWPNVLGGTEPGKGSDLIGVPDPEEKFTGTTVSEVLYELEERIAALESE